VGLILTYALTVLFCVDRLPFRRDARLSILVAARDEEDAIVDCLQALAALDYPRDQLQVLIGDDGSSDQTAALIRTFIADKPWMHYRFIDRTLPGMKGKQNVLALLAQEATGEFILVTDADIRVHPHWAAGMLGAFHRADIGVVCGTTAVWGEGWFARAQGLDWLMGLVLARAHAVLGIPITALGNNMAVRTSAYRAAGGYEAMPFSIVEDYLLFQQLCEKGPWRFVQRLHTGVSARSLPLPDAEAWLRQRKRWFQGARGLAPYNVGLIFFNGLVLPAIVIACFALPFPWGVLFLGVKLLADFLLLLIGASQLGWLQRLRSFLPYWLYYLAALVVTPILTLLPIQVIWKGRKY
jgi:cellulose synthase/poly-beta-1,6-N-acetylglucosamine synthase-like glycosyltransferase